MIAEEKEGGAAARHCDAGVASVDEGLLEGDEARLELEGWNFEVVIVEGGGVAGRELLKAGMAVDERSGEAVGGLGEPALKRRGQGSGLEDFSAAGAVSSA